MRLRRPTLFDAIGVVAVAAMLTSLAFLVLRHTAGFGELDVDVSQEELEAGFREGFEYHSLYIGSQKVGTLRTERRRNGEGYHIQTQMQFTVNAGPLSQRTESRLDAFLDAAFRLDRFELVVDGSLLSARISGRWTDDGVLVEGLPGDDAPRLFALPEAPLILPSLRPVLMRSNLGVGDRVSFTYYDPMSQAPITTDIAYLGEEQLELMGRSVQAFHFEEIALGHRANVWVNALGEVLIEELPMGVRAVREPEAEARYGLRESTGSADSDATAVQVGSVSDATLGRSRWSRATIVLDSPVALVDDAENPWQTTTQRGDRVEVRTHAAPQLPHRIVLDAREWEAYANYLGEAKGVNPQALGVRTVYREIVGDEPVGKDVPADARKSVDARAEALTHHCARVVRWEHGSDESADAERVLAAGRGDALGKARALTALLRAGKIPARVVHGLVVHGGRLVQHVWVEAWIGQWVGLDPTFDQAPADAGHIRLGAGGYLERVLARGVIEGMKVVSIDGQ